MRPGCPCCKEDSPPGGTARLGMEPIAAADGMDGIEGTSDSVCCWRKGSSVLFVPSLLVLSPPTPRKSKNDSPVGEDDWSARIESPTSPSMLLGTGVMPGVVLVSTVIGDASLPAEVLPALPVMSASSPSNRGRFLGRPICFWTE